MAVHSEFELTLNNTKYKTFSNPLMIKAETITNLFSEDPDGFNEYIRQLKKAIKARENVYNEIDEVYEALTNAPAKKKKDGSSEMDMQGQPQQTPWTIDEVRKNCTIQRMIEERLNELESAGIPQNEIDEITLTLTPSLAYHVSALMVERLRFNLVSAPHLLESYEKFVDMEAEAQKIVKKKDGADDDMDDE